MRHIFTVSLCLIGLFIGAQGKTCSPVRSECYYTGAGSISAGSANSNRYFAIGGLFDIHEKEDGHYCGTKVSPAGMLNLLAFYWSINKYGDSVLKGRQMTVGAVAFDTCMRPDQTVENILSFSECKVHIQGISQQNVVAYVGPYYEDDVERASNLAKDLKITLISPSSSDPGNDTPTLRMRPSLEYDMKAIVAFLKNRNSKLVLVVYSKEYSELYMQLNKILESMMPQGDTCNKFSFVLEDEASDNDIDTLAGELAKNKRANYVVPLMSKTMTKKLMEAVGRKNAQLIYVLTSKIGRDTIDVANFAVVVEPVAPEGNDLVEFGNFLKTIKDNDTSHANLGRSDVVNPWLDAFEDQNVVLPDVEKERSPYVFNAWRTITAVKTIIDGVHQGILTSCANSDPNNYQFCDDLRNLPDHEDKLYDYIRGDVFASNGQMKPEKISYNYYIHKNREGFKKIGSILGPNFDVADITEDLLDDDEYGFAFSGSVCPDTLQCCIPPTLPPTEPPTTIAMTTDHTDEPKSDHVYVSYPKDKEITGAFSEMHRNDDEYDTRFELGQKWIIALGVLAGLGIVCVLVFEIYILYKMVGTRMGNKWRTMWLGQLLLFGIFLAYLVCFAYIFIPTKATCGITRFGVGVAYAICFAVLLVKLMVILTSKSSDVLIPGDNESPNYLKGVYQFLMFTFAVGVQVVINIQWLITVPPEAIRVISHSGKQVWICNHYTWKTGENMLDMNHFVRTNFENHVMSLTYIMVMIVIITILSLNAHGIITNHRESVFIGIASGFSIPLWLAWGLVGGLNKDKDYGHEFGDACIAFGLFVTATLILFSMFLPKVRQLVNMGVEGIYLEDDRDTIYGGSVIMAPPSYKSKSPASVIYVNNQGIYSEPVVIGNGDPNATHLKHPGSTYSAPPTFLKKTQSTYGEGKVLRITDDLKGHHPSSKYKKPSSEINYGYAGRPRSLKGTLPRSRSQSDLGAL